MGIVVSSLVTYSEEEDLREWQEEDPLEEREGWELTQEEEEEAIWVAGAEVVQEKVVQVVWMV